MDVDTSARRHPAAFAAVAFIIAAAAVFFAGPVTAVGGAPPGPGEALSPADAAAPDRLLADGLFDPAGRRFVQFKLALRDVWTGARERDVVGWLVEPGAGNDAAGGGGDHSPRAVLLTGEAVPVVGPIAPADFVEQCGQIMDRAAAEAAELAKKEAAGKRASDDDGGDVRARRPLTPAAIGSADPVPTKYLAAWLHRLGHDAPAARMLKLARSRPRQPEVPGGDGRAVGGAAEALGRAGADPTVPDRLGPWDWYSAAVHAYMVRADPEALFYLRRMAEYFPESMADPKNPKNPKDPKDPKVPKVPKEGDKQERYPQAAQLLAELERRRAEGTFGKPAAAELPADFAAWPAERRVAHLIQQLQEVDARQQGQPGGIDLAADPRVAALIEAGDAAVPALIDCVGHDRRLTRSVHFWRDFAPSRTVLGVREAALTAVMSILRTRVFEPAAAGDNFTARGEDEAETTARRLRAYWNAHGHLPLDERMMAILTDGDAEPEAWREAAENLAHFGEGRTLGTTVWAGRVGPGREGARPNPVVLKFKAPTVAEAILAAMDRDLSRHDAGERDRMHDYDRRGIESQYVDALIDLRDASIVPALLTRLDDPENPPAARTRRALALACFTLGEARPLARFAQDVAAGRVALPAGDRPQTNAGDRPDAAGLAGIVQTLSAVAAQLPAADAALYAIAEPGHPLHDLAARRVRAARGHVDDGVWLSHPFALAILRRDLDDLTPTGTTYFVERQDDGQEMLAHKAERSSGSMSLPRELADPAVRRERAEARACDEAAGKLAGMILGVPYYHPLLADAGERLDGLRAFLDEHGPHLRRAAYAEASALDAHGSDVYYVLDVRRLPAGATAEDVAAGRAIFHLDGKGTPLGMKLPATAVLKRDQPPAGWRPTEVDVDAGRARRVWRADPDDADGRGRQVIEWDVPRVLVLQAERGPAGKRYYGVVARHEMLKASEDEVAEIEPLQDE
jgi:hypothetical protein